MLLSRWNKLTKCLQDENALLRSRCSKLENKVVSLELSVNQVEQYGRRNNIVISGIPHDVADDHLEDAVTSIMEDVDVIVQNGDTEACHRIKKSDQKSSSKKTIVRFINHKYCKKALVNRKNLSILTGKWSTTLVEIIKFLLTNI